MKRFLLSVAIAAALVAGLAHATIARVTASIAAQNTFSDPVAIRGTFNLSLSGTWVATVHLQRSYPDAPTTFFDVASYTANVEDRGTEAESGVLYRVGVKTGNYTSGTVVARISQ